MSRLGYYVRGYQYSPRWIEELTSDDYDLAGQGGEMAFVDADLCHCRNRDLFLTFDHAFMRTKFEQTGDSHTLIYVSRRSRRTEAQSWGQVIICHFQFPFFILCGRFRVSSCTPHAELVFVSRDELCICTASPATTCTCGCLLAQALSQPGGSQPEAISGRCSRLCQPAADRCCVQVLTSLFPFFFGVSLD